MTSETRAERRAWHRRIIGRTGSPVYAYGTTDADKRALNRAARLALDLTCNVPTVAGCELVPFGHGAVSVKPPRRVGRYWYDPAAETMTPPNDWPTCYLPERAA